MAEALTVPIKFHANPTQRQFIESTAEADFFCSRMREGKTTGLVWACFWHAKHNPASHWCLIRDTYLNMQRTTQETFFYHFPPGRFGVYRAAEKRYTWAIGEMRGSVYFMGIDDAADVSKLQSLSLGGFGIDEVAPAVDDTGRDTGGVDEIVFDMARSRLSQADLSYYKACCAANNPDETHWTYQRFVDPGEEGFRWWQPVDRENERNIRVNFYQHLRGVFKNRPDLWLRFGEGKFGFTRPGKSVTPEWLDQVHLVPDLAPVPGTELTLLWDFGLNPTCLITQVTPLGMWHILESYVGQDIGVEELIDQVVKPALRQRYHRYPLRHIGDPAGAQREQSQASRSAVRVLSRELGGPWTPGPRDEADRIEPLRAQLRKAECIKVSKALAREVWLSLRGGWHRAVSKGGVAGGIVKDMHSHPGDAMSYGAGVLFPLGRLLEKKPRVLIPAARAFAWGGASRQRPLAWQIPQRLGRAA